MRHLVACWIFCAFVSAPSLATSRLAIIIDDIGYNRANSLRAAQLEGKFTLAVLPYTPASREAALVAQKHQKELMLHLPMSNEHQFPVGPGGLTAALSKDEFLKVVRADIQQVPGIKGVNNHMGSELTKNYRAMTWLMEELRTQNLYFIDSRTTAQTQALVAASDVGIGRAKRDVFLDDVDTTAAITQELNRAIQTAKTKGSAIAIGHPYTNTLDILERLATRLADSGVQLVYVTDIIIPPPPKKSNAHQVPTNNHSISSASAEAACPVEEQNVLRSIIELDAKNVNMITLREH